MRCQISARSFSRDCTWHTPCNAPKLTETRGALLWAASSRTPHTRIMAITARPIQLDPTPRPPGYPLDAILDIRRRFEAKRLFLANPLERVEHAGLVDYVTKREGLTRTCYGMHHAHAEIASASQRGTAARLGSREGFPDLAFFHPFELDGRHFSGLAEEMKRVTFTFPGIAALEQRVAASLARGKSNKAAQHLLDQARWLQRLRGWGWIAEFTRGEWEGTELFEMCYGRG